MDVESTSAAAPSQGAAAARRPIGEFLVERGLVTEEQLKQALAEQRSSGKRLGEILVERGAITRMALASVLGEQWEEAGRHLRAVVPVRLAGGKEADAGLAGGEELTDSLASLQAAVARLEDLSGGPGSERVVVGDEAIEASLAGLGRQLAELRDAVGAPMVVETDHLGDRLAELDAFLRGRDEQVAAKLTELVEAVTSVPAVEPDPGVGERLDRIDAWLRDAPTGTDPEVAERLGRVEALLTERAGAEAVAPELARRLDEIEAAAKRPRDRVDLTPIEQRLDALDASVTEALSAPVAEAPTEALVMRLEALEQSLGAVRTAVEAPRQDPVVEALLARFDELRAALSERESSQEVSARLGGLEERLGSRDLAWEASVERLGRLEDSVREALDRPVADGVGVGADVLGRLDELRAAIAGLDGSAGAARTEELAERFASLERSLDAVRSAVDSPRDDGVVDRLASVEQVLGNRDLAWEAAVERLGRLEDSVREALARTGTEDVVGADLVARLEALQAVAAGLDGSAGAARSVELAERFGSLEQSLDALRGAVESPRGDGVPERLAAIEHVLGNGDLAWEAAVERLGRLEDSVREAVARREDDGVGDTVLARLDELRSAVDSSRDHGVSERLGALEQMLGGRELAWEAAVERLGRLEETIREATPPREDGRLDEVLGRLGELRQAVEAPDESVLHRLEGLEHTIREATAPREDGRVDEVLGRLGELRQAVEAPGDETVLHRLEGLEHTIREATAPREDGRLDEALARLDALRGDLVSAHESRLTLDGVRALLDEQRQALDGADRSGEAIGLLRKLARESAEASEALAVRIASGLTEGFAELRAAADQPDASLEPLGELARRLDALEPIKAALDELCRNAAEPAGARFLERLVARSHNQIAERIGELERAIHIPETDTAALAERDARIAELVQQLNARPASTPAPVDERPRPGDTTSFVALVPASDGYRLVALEGTLPAAGDGLAVPDDDRALVVARLGRSPYPGDARPCAYLQAS